MDERATAQPCRTQHHLQNNSERTCTEMRLMSVVSDPVAQIAPALPRSPAMP
jgi:hypothetical protein